MFYLNSVLENFQNCCKLPIYLLDNNYNVLNKSGHTDITEEIISNLKILKNLGNHKLEDTYSVLDYNNNISFLLKPYIFNINKPLFFLIGPFYNNSENKEYNLSLLPPSTYKYINNLLSQVLDDIYDKSYNPFINRAIQYIHSNYFEDISMDKICHDLKINKCYFCNLFKKETGYTFTQFLTMWRIEKSKIFLKNPSLTLFDVALNVGFNNQGYYSTTFKKITGITPSEYKAAL
ncbi:helix-turn-helix domain-containing protein [Clostridium paraputrificum]|uniref:helix-turn-helix domain-containing protein n=1 Tax=Clostridium TaxID=1485 RepID=UPI003D336918